MIEYVVNVERDSVCMGDDVDAPHSYSFRVSSTATLKDIFVHLSREGYLASVAGRNYSWQATINNQPVAVFLGNNRTPEPSALLANEVSQYAHIGCINLQFRYTSATT
jgi:Na+-transporting NADH:ubiquinone oxidoreductase subunit NqrA